MTGNTLNFFVHYFATISIILIAILIACIIVIIISIAFIIDSIRISKRTPQEIYDHYRPKSRLFKIHSHTAAKLCYFTFIPWLIAFVRCEDKEEISGDLSRGFIYSFLYLIPVVNLAFIIRALMRINEIGQDVYGYEGRGSYEKETFVFNIFKNYYHNPKKHMILPIFFIIMSVLMGVVGIFGYVLLVLPLFI